MSAVASREIPLRESALLQPRPKRRSWTRLILPTYTAIVIVYLMVPIFVMIIFGFNNTHGRFNLVWQGFTLSWYQNLFAIPDLTTSLINSLVIGVSATAVSTVLGTMIALALDRYAFPGKSALNLTLFLNIAAPEIVMGATLLALFIQLQIPQGLLTIFLAHVMFIMAYVTVTVRARLAGFDRSLEEAAQDLGAPPLITFRKVTLPLIFPGIMAGALLAFALSIDDFVTTYFVAGSVNTFPLWVYGATREGVPPQVNVMGTLIFAGGVLLALLNVAYQRRAAKLQ
ncbi:MAG TPA: ABC transporter permease [Chloroflexota bacterium]|nr:ABC transporter permease [Chloroflexota bacterium]